ncbi:ankyrin repeat-containing domain protein [Lasiosphaeria hispida]|uniref:Ankyrin repeat-containing domain protein n=1 Tax=Lasiosphaeria hispida TaxID=260671 RepID=A0AAJ0M8U4_9PEZI|nr:ankyrin repeat-containing domain protein [Lasiosphaeria hispida]
MESRPSRLSLQSVSTLRWSAKSSQSTLTANSLPNETARDKPGYFPECVYAAFGASPETLSSKGISPDYSLQWDELFRHLTRHLLSSHVSVLTYRDQGIAVIEGKGRIVGLIASVSHNINKEEVVGVAWKSSRGVPGQASKWTTPVSDNSVRTGDMVFVLDRSPALMIVRIRKDHVRLIRVVVSPPGVGAGAMQALEGPLYELLITWGCPSLFCNTENEVEEEWFDGIQILDADGTGQKADLAREHRLFNMGLLLRDAQESGAAEERFREVVCPYGNGLEDSGEWKAHSPWHKHWRKRKSHASVLVSLLLKHGDGPPALRYAAKHGLEMVAKLLLGSGNKCSDGGKAKTLFALAAKRGHWATARSILDAVSEGFQTSQEASAGRDKGVEPENGSRGLVTTTLARGWACRDTTSPDGLTPLMCAVIGNDRQAIELLLDIGSVDLDARDMDGRTALIWAIRMRNMTAVDLLLETGRVSPGTRDNLGLTPFMWASVYRDDSCAQRLLDETNRVWWRRRPKAEPTYRDVYEYALFS